MTTKFYNQDRIEISEIEERIEELDGVAIDPADPEANPDVQELAELQALYDIIEGDGDTLISTRAWKQYIIEEWQQVVEDSNLPDFLRNNIDWQGAADDASSEHTSVDFDGQNYYVV